MKITIVKEFTFDAAHRLPGYDGPCHRLHGHTYKLQVGLRGEIDHHTGMVVDFVKLKDVVGKQVVEKLDHKYLNNDDDLIDSGFPYHMPTAENMVRWIVGKLTEWCYDQLVFVRLYETPTSYAEWRKDDA